MLALPPVNSNVSSNELANTPRQERLDVYAENIKSKFHVVVATVSEINRLTKAEYLIMRYAEDWLVQLRLLGSPDLEEALNIEAHGLVRSELATLLFTMFDHGLLVAKTDERGYFTPSLKEIELALDEPGIESAHRVLERETFYGITSASVERYKELKKLFEVA